MIGQSTSRRSILLSMTHSLCSVTLTKSLTSWRVLLVSLQWHNVCVD